MPRILGFLFALFVALSMAPAFAMDFELLQESDGQRVVFASGLIGPGDAQLLAAALKAATRDRHRTKELLLDKMVTKKLTSIVTEDFADFRDTRLREVRPATVLRQ